jgi:DNA mismatch endonuclease (patch repair protein)
MVEPSVRWAHQPSSPRASRTMSRIRATDTKAEILLRRAVWRLGLRFRKNYAKLPGKPDLVFTRQKLAVFCDGDFWHGRDWLLRRKKLQYNRDYWVAKIERNMRRDKETDGKLERSGWAVLRLWEGDILSDPETCAVLVQNKLIELRSALSTGS